MLQQTQATRVVPKYLQFIEEFPNMANLITASNSKILSIWAGLGYNKRALWLKETVKSIGNIDNFPLNPQDLEKYKGIGKYSSNSILIFSYNQNLCAVDVNIKKILLKFKFIQNNSKEKEIYHVAYQLLPKNRSRDWHNAMMDYSALNLKKFKIKNKSKVTPFKGSIRQIRGKVVKMLTQFDMLTIDEIQEEIPAKNLLEILQKLEKEGLIAEENSFYHL